MTPRKAVMIFAGVFIEWFSSMNFCIQTSNVFMGIFVPIIQIPLYNPPISRVPSKDLSGHNTRPPR